jgi:excisionase family DNA binding protein
MDSQNNKVLSFEEGCQYLGFKKSYVYKLTANATLPFSKPNGRKIFFDREKLEAWMLGNSKEKTLQTSKFSNHE